MAFTQEVKAMNNKIMLTTPPLHELEEDLDGDHGIVLHQVGQLGGAQPQGRGLGAGGSAVVQLSQQPLQQGLD